MKKKGKDRQDELRTCIDMSLASREVDMVFLLSECGTENLGSLENNNRLQVAMSKERPTFKDLFELANSCSKEGDIIIICNTDVYPFYGTKDLIKNINQNECYALSRWDIDSLGNLTHLNRRDSNDSWVFRAPIKNVENMQCDFYMGMAGCDNRIGYEIQQAGYAVSNPSITIKFCHLHLTNIRNYNPSIVVPSPYLLIEPTAI